MSVRPLRLLAVLVLFAGTLTAFTYIQSAPYDVDKTHSQVQFKVKHLGITTVTGTFHDFDVDLNLDPADVASLQTSATVQIASVDTGNERRDGHLRSEDFFHADAHPTMAFESTGVQNVDGNEFELLGNLTIRGVTLPVAFEAEMAGPVTGPQGKPRVAFTASTEINRKDYGLEWGPVVEGVNVVSDNVDIILEVQAVPADA
ncbi:MAG: YceI family protein [Bacteroidota bacterium]